MSRSESVRTLPAGLWVAVGALGVMTVAVVAGTQPASAAIALLAVAAIGLWHRTVLDWHVLLGAIVVVISFIPIKRYTLPGSLPFELEPYRVLVALVAMLWIAALLIDDRVRLRRSPLDAPVLLFGFALLASVVANPRHIVKLDVTTEVIKSLTFFSSFVLLYVIATSVLTSRERIDAIVRTLVWCGAGIGLATLYEYWSGDNLFNHLGQVIPALNARPLSDLGLSQDTLSRSGRLRVYGSAQHPIALAAALVMLVPLAYALWESTHRQRWLVLGAIISMGAFATISRTAVVMFVAVAVVFLVVRFQETKRLVPFALPALLVLYFALPNSLGSFYSAFFPQGGLVAEQSGIVQGNEAGANGRLADLGPWWDTFEEHPVLGQGFGSRVVARTASPAINGNVGRNSLLLDDQWLGTMLDVGLVGTAAFAWVIVRAFRRLRRLSRGDPSPDGWLPLAIASSIVAFGVGMFTYDAFGFIQVTMFAFILLGLAGALLNLDERHPVARG